MILLSIFFQALAPRTRFKSRGMHCGIGRLLRQSLGSVRSMYRKTASQQCSRWYYSSPNFPNSFAGESLESLAYLPRWLCGEDVQRLRLLFFSHALPCRTSSHVFVYRCTLLKCFQRPRRLTCSSVRVPCCTSRPAPPWRRSCGGPTHERPHRSFA